MNCVYCEDASIQARLITENELAWSFPTNIPIVPGHILICPKRHVARLEDLSDEELKALLGLRLELKAALAKTFNCEGFNYAWNEGAVAGQSVPHLHLHMLPRREGDSGITEYEPRKFLYRPGSREATPEEELRAVADSIRSQLQND